MSLQSKCKGISIPEGCSWETSRRSSSMSFVHTWTKIWLKTSTSPGCEAAAVMSRCSNVFFGQYCWESGSVSEAKNYNPFRREVTFVLYQFERENWNKSRDQCNQENIPLRQRELEAQVLPQSLSPRCGSEIFFENKNLLGLDTRSSLRGNNPLWIGRKCSLVLPIM